MKRIILSSLLVLCTLTISKSQVFNSAQTLSKGSFAIGLEPAIITGGNDFYLFIHGGYGIKSGLDLALKFGVGEGANYVGADLEFALRKNISLAVGAHSFNNFGLDGALLFNIPIKSDIKLITGIDTDLNFPPDNVDLALWIPVGLEIYLRKNMSMIFECEIDILNNSYHLFGGGVTFFF